MIKKLFQQSLLGFSAITVFLTGCSNFTTKADLKSRQPNQVEVSRLLEFEFINPIKICQLKKIFNNCYEFQMGSPHTEFGRFPDEDIKSYAFSYEFEIQKNLVTQEQYFQVMKSNPSTFQQPENCSDQILSSDNYKVVDGVSLCPHHPLENITYDQAQQFVAKLNEIAADSNYSYRLPTEEEWEYSVRGGTKTAFWFGEQSSLAEQAAWHIFNSRGRTHSVNECPSQNSKWCENQFGLKNSVGNVWQWTQPVPQILTSASKTSSQVFYVARGGDFQSPPHLIRSAYRSSSDQVAPIHFSHGLRLVRVNKNAQ